MGMPLEKINFFKNIIFGVFGGVDSEFDNHFAQKFKEFAGGLYPEERGRIPIFLK